MKMWTWFLSFRDTDLNVSLGACVVTTLDGDPPDISYAAQAAWDLGCNPGGEVLGFTAEGSDPNIADAVEALPRFVLLTRAQVEATWSEYGVHAGRPGDDAG